MNTEKMQCNELLSCVKVDLYSTMAHNCHCNNKKNTVDKENLTNKNVSLTCKKGLLPYKQDLLTYTKKYSLTYTKNPRQIATANSHGK